MRVDNFELPHPSTMQTLKDGFSRLKQVKERIINGVVDTDEQNIADQTASNLIPPEVLKSESLSGQFRKWEGGINHLQVYGSGDNRYVVISALRYPPSFEYYEVVFQGANVIQINASVQDQASQFLRVRR